MTHNNYPKGSNWIKCDLHVHTPKSIEQGYGGDTDEAWEKFFTDLENLPESFQIIGINDYLFLDGYEKVKEVHNSGRMQNIKLFLPVIEFRLNIFAGNKDLDKINFHVLFSDEIDVSIIRRHFLDKLNVKKEIDRDNIWDDVINDLQKLEEYGEFNKQNFPEEFKTSQSLKQIGFSNLTYSIEDIYKLLNKHHFKRGGSNLFLTIIGRTEWANMRWESAGADKKEIINKADFVFAASETIEQYNNSREKLKNEGVNYKLLHCSDAHYFTNNEDAPDNMIIGHSYSWIKANPTFEGLRQLLFEYEERYISSTDNQLHSKAPYTIIDKVKFIDNTGGDKFQSSYIELNPYLNTIIGGKSTGKSLLINHIAKTVDPDEYNKNNGNTKTYNHEINSNFDFHVVWKDGQTDFLKGENNNRKIVYISQNHIDELTNSQVQNVIKLNGFIQNIILQSEDAKSFYDDNLREIKKIQTEISEEIVRLLNYRDKLNDTIANQKKIGDLKGIEKYIEQIQIEIKKINEGLNSKQAEEYDKISTELSEIERYLKILEDMNLQFKEAKKDVFEDFQKANRERKRILEIFQLADLSISIKEKSERIAKFEEQIRTEYNDINREIYHVIEKEKKKKDELSSVIEKYAKKSNFLKKLRDDFNNEEQKLNLINQIQKEINSLKNQITVTKENIENRYREIYNIYKAIASKFKEFADVSGDLSINILVGYNNKEFNATIQSSNTNKRDIKRLFPDLLDLNSEYAYNFTELNHFDFVKQFMDNVFSGDIRLNQGGSVNQIISSLFSNFFYLNYSMKYKGDFLDEMSPGKKNLVLLKILIELSNSDNPILIDQPEDDLDNRSIYSELVKFLKEKKNQRQILIVTHNPNVVIGADAEEIIVANQEGQVDNRENAKYQFEYVSGGIENSFKDETKSGILYQLGIKEHICDILEGGVAAFQEREKRYNFEKNKK